jgi:hypothetical protein
MGSDAEKKATDAKENADSANTFCSEVSAQSTVMPQNPID